MAAMMHAAQTFLDSTDLLADPLALRARAEEEGYLFFRNLLPREDVLRVRAYELAVVERHGWRKPGLDLLDNGIDVEALSQLPESAMRTDIGVSLAAYHDVQKLESMHRLPHHPRLLAVYRALFGGEVFVHPRHIARMITPHPSVSPTPPHQDFPLIQGTNRTWTAWFPLGDCPRELGALRICRRSDQIGYIPIRPSPGAGGIAAQLCPGEHDWVEGDFAAGDVLTFTSLTVHCALKCQFKDSIRLSLDVRYQPLDDIIEAKSLLPHCELTWEQIYANWSRDDLKYYWGNLPLRFSPWDETLLQPKRRIC
jgi:ectoine hydroxylase-related dioxygenase (phytanoyl-CoA dioxygenase family)